MPDLFPIFTHLSHPTPHTQLSLRYLPISFRFVFSRLLYPEKTHDMCFFTCLFAFTHNFLPATCQPASGLCFLACSPMKKHTTCVFSLAYMLLHTIFSPAICQPASSLCFPACSTLKKHTTCVFSLIYMLLHTVFSPATCLSASGACFPAGKLPHAKKRHAIGESQTHGVS